MRINTTQRRGTSLKCDGCTSRKGAEGNKPQEGGGNGEQNVGPKQVHRERNDVQDPVNVSHGEDGLQTIMRGGIAHVLGQPGSK
jgi:hypothetical protein